MDKHGHSCLPGVGETIYRTYSTYAQGIESLGGGYCYLDMTALGRREEWEEPEGRSEDPRAARPDFAS